MACFCGDPLCPSCGSYMGHGAYRGTVPRPRAPVSKLGPVITQIRADVWDRYKTLRDKGVSEAEAVNIAAAQAATYGKARPRPSSARYRSELEAMIRREKARNDRLPT